MRVAFFVLRSLLMGTGWLRVVRPEKFVAGMHKVANCKALCAAQWLALLVALAFDAPP